MDLVIPDTLLQAAHVSADELKREIAILLFQQEKLTLAQASRLADMPQMQFQHVLAGRGIALHYDIDDFQQDLETLRAMGVL